MQAYPASFISAWNFKWDAKWAAVTRTRITETHLAVTRAIEN